LQELEQVVPYTMQDFHTDNGGEFLNWALHRHLTGRAVQLPWTRSRAFRKNDNAHCEQKNWTHVRQLFGHDRFEHPELVALMNDLYAQEWSQFTNHFKPTFKLLKREKQDSKTKRVYEKTPQTPYQRLLASPDIPEVTKAKLRAEHVGLDPQTSPNFVFEYAGLFLYRIFTKMNLTNLVRLKAGLNAGLVFTLTGAALCCVKPASAAAAKDTEALILKLPSPTLKGTPEDLPVGPNIEPLSDKPRPAFMVPKGLKNVAEGKTVTSSVKPFTGELNQITDGKKEAFDYDSVEMKKGSQWVQVDLGETFAIYAVVMWHDHRYIQVMHDVIVQVSDDPEFQKGVTTVFNNDADNSSGLGVGTDREYFETYAGKIVDGKGAKGRYVRTYTKGGSLSALNCWQEIEVYALPAK
jgi:hypothetical protein